MSKAALVLFAIIMGTLYNQLLKVLFDIVSLPNIVTVLRDLLVFWLFIIGLGKKEFWNSQPLVLAYGFFLLFFVQYIFISILQGKLIAGLYYARIYFLPIMFFIGCNYVISRASYFRIEAILRWALRLNLLTILVSLSIYALVLTSEHLRTVFLGSDTLAAAWYLGGAGLSIIRMGLPFTSPNSLGTVLALNACLVLLLIVLHTRQKLPIRSLVILLILNIISLTLTFSRSAMLLFVIAALILLFTPGVANRRLFFRAAFLAFLVVAVGITSLYFANVATNGLLENWLLLNLNLSDPSLKGHSSSITNAFDKISEYYLYGYERGTVGPKAELFNKEFNNVENSFLAIIYDNGIFSSILFIFCYVVLILYGYKNRFQWGILIGFIVNLLILPIIFEPDVMSYFLFIFMLIGRINLKQAPKVSARRDSPTLLPLKFPQSHANLNQ